MLMSGFKKEETHLDAVDTDQDLGFVDLDLDLVLELVDDLARRALAALLARQRHRSSRVHVLGLDLERPHLGVLALLVIGRLDLLDVLSARRLALGVCCWLGRRELLGVGRSVERGEGRVLAVIGAGRGAGGGGRWRARRARRAGR